jgi:hypothetical protein
LNREIQSKMEHTPPIIIYKMRIQIIKRQSLIIWKREE